MAGLSDAEVQEIIARVHGRVATADLPGRAGRAIEASDALTEADDVLGEGVYATVDQAVAAARTAFATYRSVGLDARKGLIEAVRVAMRAENERLAYMARQETGIGRADDKVLKNALVIEQTPGPEDFGLNREEIVIVAHVARYHRRSAPKPSHVDYMSLPREARVVVNKLAAILRVADALSRGQAQQIRELQFERQTDELVVYVSGVSDFMLEQRALSAKGDLFEDIYGMRVRLEEA